jgi:hypothetical protein
MKVLVTAKARNVKSYGPMLNETRQMLQVCNKMSDWLGVMH